MLGIENVVELSYSPKRRNVYLAETTLAGYFAQLTLDHFWTARLSNVGTLGQLMPYPRGVEGHEKENICSGTNCNEVSPVKERPGKAVSPMLT